MQKNDQNNKTSLVENTNIPIRHLVDVVHFHILDYPVQRKLYMRTIRTQVNMVLVWDHRDKHTLYHQLEAIICRHLIYVSYSPNQTKVNKTFLIIKVK